MRMEEYIAFLTEQSKDEQSLTRLREGTPLGTDAYGEAVLSQKTEHAYTVRNTCVTGLRRTGFIRKLIMSLSCIYAKHEANFLVLSPRTEYGELMRLRTLDITVPFMTRREDLDNAFQCVRDLMIAHAQNAGCPKLFLVLDGLEEIEGCNKNADFEEYRTFMDLTARSKNIELITGADLLKSIFSGNPGVFVGVGNCLVTTREEGNADVTYVQEDSSLSMPTALSYAETPSVMETVIYLNSTAVQSDETER